MNVKHTAEIREVLKAGDRVLQERIAPARDFADSYTVWSYMYRLLGVHSYGWRDPITHELFEKAPTYSIEVVNPDDILEDGQLCDCRDCLGEELADADIRFVAE